MHILVLLCSIWEINSLFSFFLQSYLLKRENSKALYWLKGFFKKLSYTEILNLVNACFKISRVAALTQQHKAVSMFLRTSGWSSVLRKAGLFFFILFFFYLFATWVPLIFLFCELQCSPPESTSIILCLKFLSTQDFLSYSCFEIDCLANTSFLFSFFFFPQKK